MAAAVACMAAVVASKAAVGIGGQGGGGFHNGVPIGSGRIGEGWHRGHHHDRQHHHHWWKNPMASADLSTTSSATV